MNEQLNKLTNKVEFLKDLTKAQEVEALNLIESLKRIEGFSYGIKEIFNKFAEFSKKKKTEILDLIKEGKLNQQVANLMIGMLNSSSQFLEKEMNESEKLLHIKQGELIATKNQAKKSNELLKTLESNLENTKQIVEIESNKIPAAEQPKEERIRLDKDPNTKIGRAALDLAERKKKLNEKAPAKRGRKPSSPKH